MGAFNFYKYHHFLAQSLDWLIVIVRLSSVCLKAKSYSRNHALYKVTQNAKMRQSPQYICSVTMETSTWTPIFLCVFFTWYGISFKKNLGSLNYYGPNKSFVNVASLLNIIIKKLPLRA